MADAVPSQANKELSAEKILQLPMQVHPQSLANATGYDFNVQY